MNSPWSNTLIFHIGDLTDDAERRNHKRPPLSSERNGGANPGLRRGTNEPAGRHGRLRETSYNTKVQLSPFCEPGALRDALHPDEASGVPSPLCRTRFRQKGASPLFVMPALRTSTQAGSALAVSESGGRPMKPRASTKTSAFPPISSNWCLVPASWSPATLPVPSPRRACWRLDARSPPLLCYASSISKAPLSAGFVSR